jgi:hypothetical protein
MTTIESTGMTSVIQRFRLATVRRLPEVQDRGQRGQRLVHQHGERRHDREPAEQLDIIPWLCLAWLVSGVVLALVLRKRSPEKYEVLGRMVNSGIN